MCDAGMILQSDMDYQDRSEIIFNEIKGAHSTYNLNNSSIKIYHIGRTQKRLFDANVYSWNGRTWKT